MIGVEVDLCVGDPGDDRRDHLPGLIAHLDHLTNHEIQVAGQLRALGFDYLFHPVRPVGLLGGNLSGFDLARGHLQDDVFETLDHLIGAELELERFPVSGTVELGAVLQEAAVMDFYGIAFLDLAHSVSPCLGVWVPRYAGKHRNRDARSFDGIMFGPAWLRNHATSPRTPPTAAWNVRPVRIAGGRNKRGAMSNLDRIVFLLVPLASVLACSQQNAKDTGQPYVPPTWDEDAPAIDCAYGTPDAPMLDAVLEDAGLTLEEVGYSDTDWSYASYASVLDDPFRLSWFYTYQFTPLTYPCLGGQVAWDLDYAAATPHPVASALGQAMALLDVETTSQPLDPRETQQDLVDLSSLPQDLAEALAPILVAMDLVAQARDELAAGIDVDLESLVDYGNGGVILDYYVEPDLSDDDIQDWVLSANGPRLLYEPARILAFALEEADLARFAGTDAVLDELSSLGRIVVAGPQHDEPGEMDDVAFYLDLGGDDSYVYPAGASSESLPVSVHVDLGGDDSYGYIQEDDGSDALLPSDSEGRYSGDDYYGEFSLSRVGRQGSGRAGVGILMDLGKGDDLYQSLRMSQGWAHLGVGLLYDDGGDDIYLAEEGAQGGASMGIGIFMDASGDDIHNTFVNSQGFAYVQAVGIAWDGGGNDTWYANPGKAEDGGTVVYYSPQLPGSANSSMCQGSGFGMRWDSEYTYLSGGVGILRDASGDDTYTAGLFAQGSGYWQSVGLLLDGQGSDTYDAYYYVQGGAAHYSAGVLLDDGPGDDRFNTIMEPNYMQIGAGHDFSVGVLVNEQGDDTYVYGGLAGGASNCEGIGIFVDNDGQDVYQVSSSYSTGLGNHSSECIDTTRVNVDAIGLFMDSGGDEDSYDWPDEDGHPQPGNDSSFGYAWSGEETEKGGAVDGDGETGVHAGGELP